MSLFTYLRTYLRAFVSNDEGQDLLEYALIIAVGTTGTNVNAIFTRIGEELGDALPYPVCRGAGHMSARRTHQCDL